MKQVAELPKNWSIDLDEELVEMIKDSINTDPSGSIRNFIKSITLSSQRVSFLIKNILVFSYTLIISF